MEAIVLACCEIKSSFFNELLLLSEKYNMSELESTANVPIISPETLRW